LFQFYKQRKGEKKGGFSEKNTNLRKQHMLSSFPVNNIRSSKIKTKKSGKKISSTANLINIKIEIKPKKIKLVMNKKKTQTNLSKPHQLYCSEKLIDKGAENVPENSCKFFKSGIKKTSRSI